MPSLCRDCLTIADPERGDAAASPAAGEAGRLARCPSCRSPRTLSHPELTALGVAHMDCDSFYAAVEKRDDPSLADKPLIIGGGRRGVVSTACYIARIAGVRSAMPMFKALDLCPDAVVLPPRMDVYVAVSREIRALMLEATPLVEPLSLDEAFMDLRGTERLHGLPPAAVMARLVARIEAEIGVTASVGLSHNKYLAKIASDLDKPRGFSIIGEAETMDFLADQPVSIIWGVGKAMQAKLKGDGLNTLSDIRRQEPEALLARYGSMGRRLAALSRGEDARPISAEGGMKSISAETTFNEDIGGRDLLEAHIWRLAVRVADRAKAKDLQGATVVLKLKTPDFRTITRQHRPGAPTQLADTIFREARDLLALVIERAPFRLIGVGISDLSDATGDQGAPADLFDPEAAKRARAERASDAIRARFGADAIAKGRALG